MKEIRISGNETIASVEEHLAGLQATTCDVDLVLPSAVTERIGVDASLLQFLMTWSQKQNTPRLRTYVDTRRDPTAMLETLCERVVGISAVTLSRSITSVDKQDIRASAWKAAGNQVQQMIRDEAHFQRGTSYAVLCFDGTTMAWPSNLYHPTREVRSLGEFEAIFGLVLERSETRRVRRERIQDVVMRLGSILFETFRNTDQWARTGVDGVPISRGVRGLLVRRYREPSSDMARRHAEDAPISEFLAHHVNSEDERRVGVLELSVFDGGPGLVRRYRDTNALSGLSLAEERSVCLECFDKHKTSSKLPHRGVGLHAAMRDLSSLGGLLRLRTGRLSLYRNFAKDPFEDGLSARFSDWPTPGHASGVAEVAGAVLTFVLPIPEEEVA
jgi:hypothetical protein